MTIPQADMFLSSLENPGKWGWKTTHDKIATYLLKNHKKRVRGHKDPDGKMWPKLFVPPRPKIGEKHPMLLDNTKSKRSVIVQKVKSNRGKRRVMAYRKKFGIPTKKLHSLHRKTVPSGFSKKLIAPKIWDFLSSRGKSVRTARYSLTYGFTPGTEWVKQHQFGGSYNGKKVPKREIVGMNMADVKKIEDIYLFDYKRKISRGKR